MRLPRSGADRALLAAVAIGIALRLWQWFGGASLWIDELAIAHNIAERDLGTLLAEPLRYSQVAPPGFMALEWIAFHALGGDDWTLRLVPLLGGCASLLLFVLLARRLLEPAEAVTAAFLFACAPVVARYAAIAKPYAGDVAIVLALILLAIRALDRAPRAQAAFAAVAIAAPWLSHPAVFAVAGLLPLLAWDLRGRAPPDRTSALAGLMVAGLSLGAAVWWADRLVPPSMLDYMRDFWAEYLPPVAWQERRDLLWPGRAALEVVRVVLPDWNPSAFMPGRVAVVVATLPLVVIAVGAWRLVARHRARALCVLAPLGVALVAVALRRYPIASRLVLWMTPILVVCLVAGASALVARLPAADRWRTAALGALVLFGFWNTAQHLPVVRLQETGPVVRAVAANLQPGDAILLHPGARLGVAWYGPRAGLPLAGIRWAKCVPDDPRGLLRAVDSLRGARRAWFIVSNSYGPSGEMIFVPAYLDTIGRRLELIAPQGVEPHGPLGASALLYDLSDAGRLRATTAETFELPAPPEGTRWHSHRGYCGGPEGWAPPGLPHAVG